jgi:N-acetylmuramoyl-L-alanine amidase
MSARDRGAGLLAATGTVLLLGSVLLLPAEASAQAGGPGSPGPVTLAWSDGRTATLAPERHRGYAAIPAGALAPLGWIGSEEGDLLLLRHHGGLELRLRPGSPFLRWDGAPVQMVHPPYRFGDHVYVPLQLLVDLLPGFLPGAYAWDPEARLLRVDSGAVGRSARGGTPPPTRTGGEEAADRPPPGAPLGGDARTPRLVVIDPGHGGHDTGAIGPGGVREKDVALAVSLALARELSADPSLEVRLTRTADEFVPLWERGARATEWKGERPGLFLSIHANAVPDRPGVRGFETYFLAEARTEHERRVAAAENQSLGFTRDGQRTHVESDPLLGHILRDLRTFDHQHWSALLAEIVQEELGAVHPGPDRGVRQGPFAVITNSLMPSVLIEVGFLSNREEERLLVRPEFHRDTARAVSRSVHRFFERYPPGSATP